MAGSASFDSPATSVPILWASGVERVAGPERILERIWRERAPIASQRVGGGENCATRVPRRDVPPRQRV